MTRLPDILPPYSEDDRMISGLAYPLWPFVVPIILLGDKRQEAFVHFHALQALALGLASLVASFVVGLLTIFAMWLLPSWSIAISGMLGLGVFFAVSFVLLMYLTFILYIAWKAGGGAFFRLPFIGHWAEDKMQHNLGITYDDYSTQVIGQRREGAELKPFVYDDRLEKYNEQENEVVTSYVEGTLEENYDGDETFEYSKAFSPDLSAHTQGATPAMPSARKTPGLPNNAARTGPRPISSPMRAGGGSGNQANDGSFRSLADTLGPRPAPAQTAPTSATSSIKWKEDFSAPTPSKVTRIDEAPPTSNYGAPNRRDGYKVAVPPSPGPRTNGPATRNPVPTNPNSFRQGIVPKPPSFGTKTNSFRFNQLDDNTQSQPAQAPPVSSPPRRLPPAPAPDDDGFQAWRP